MLKEFRGYPVKRRVFHYLGRRLELLGPGNFETLIDDPRVQRRFDVDEYMPYWAEFWPACLLLADLVDAWPVVSHSADASAGPPPRVLEVGCGLGLVSLIAAAKGYDVIASDYDDDALAFVELSAAENGIPTPELRFVDWRRTYPDLRLDRVVAAEILFEVRNLVPVARFLAEHLKPDGEALIVDGNRQTADGFPAVAAAAGLTIEQSPIERSAVSTGDPPIRGRLFRVLGTRRMQNDE